MNRKRKVGILTYHLADNSGAVLQCYALQEAIKLLGVDVEIIDYRHKNIAGFPKLFKNPFRTPGTKLILIVKILISNIVFLPMRLIRRLKFYKFRYTYLNTTRQKHVDLKQLALLGDEFTHFITGSDQVWNPVILGGLDKGYFLDFPVPGSKKVSYAASLGENMEERFHGEFKKCLSSFDHISVREPSTKGFVSKFTDNTVDSVLDPTLLIPAEDWKKISKFRNIGKYVFVYDIWFDDLVAKIVDAVSASLGLKVVCYQKSSIYKNGKKSFGYEGPSEFLGLLIESEFVVTSSFHGTTLAVANRKDFITIPHPTRGARMIDLLDTLKLSDRLVDSIEKLKTIDLKSHMDYTLAYKILEVERGKSMGFLKSALE